MTIEFTRRGYIEVWKGTTRISQHTSEYEAIESLSKNGPGDYEIRFPRIMAKAYGVLSPGGDTTPPTAPGSFTGTAGSATTVNLTWTASTDNIGVAGYQLFRNGVPFATTSNLSYTDTGRSPSTQYSYTITAFDAAGNNSTVAGPALVTTNSNSAPVWALGNQSYNNGTAVNISLDSVCTDADGDTITYSLVSGSLPTGLALSGARNQTLSGTVTADGTFAFTLGASDGIAAVQNVSLTFTVSTPDTTAPDAPSAPSIAGFTSSTITLSLPTSAASDHSSYTIQRSTDGTNYGSRATGVTASFWQDTGLNASTTYYYRLIDVDTSGNASVSGSAVSQQTASAATGTNAARINTLLAGRTPHFSYNMPADPVTTTTQTVTSAAQFNQYSNAGSGGVRIIVNSSFSGGISISRNDIDVVMSNGATITGTVNVSGSRVRWTGGNIAITTAEGFGLSSPSDVLFDDVAIVGGVTHNFSAGGAGFNRVAFINSTLQVTSSPGGTGWSIFMMPGAHNDLIIGNCKVMRGGYQVARFQQVTRLVVFDTVFNPNENAGNGCRVGRQCNYVWFKDSWARHFCLFGSQTGGDTGPAFTNAVFDNFDRYYTSNQYIEQSGFTNNTGTVMNSTMYSTGGSSFPGVSPLTSTNNNFVLWDGTTVPDYSSVGAIR